MNKLSILALLGLTVVGLTGCVTSPSYAHYPSSYDRGHSGYTYERQPTYERSTRGYGDQHLVVGEVVDVRQVWLESRAPSGAGAIGGALIGGLIGSQIGSGSGRDAATIVGALVGASSGAEAQRRSERPVRAYEITVLVDDGYRSYRRTILQPTAEGIYEGAVVRLEGSGNRTRVYLHYE